MADENDEPFDESLQEEMTADILINAEDTEVYSHFWLQ